MTASGPLTDEELAELASHEWHAQPAVPRLIDDVRTSRAEVERLREQDVALGREVNRLKAENERLTNLTTGYEEVTVRHWLVMSDDHCGSSFSISDRQERAGTAERIAKSWLRPGYHIEVQDQTWLSGPAIWTTVRCDKKTT